MKIEKVKDSVKNLDGKTVGGVIIDIETVISQVKSTGDIPSLLKGLEEIKTKATSDITFLKVLENACFANIENEKENAGKFTDALDLIGRIRSESDLKDTEIEEIKKGILKTTYNALTKAMVIQKVTKPAKAAK